MIIIEFNIYFQVKLIFLNFFFKQYHKYIFYINHKTYIIKLVIVLLFRSLPREIMYLLFYAPNTAYGVNLNCLTCHTYILYWWREYTRIMTQKMYITLMRIRNFRNNVCTESVYNGNSIRYKLEKYYNIFIVE